MSKVDSMIKAGINKNNQAISNGLIGVVTKYYPATYTNKKHAHTVDVKIYRTNSYETLEKVPCFVYSTGLIDYGLQENDRVYIEYINGDPTLPIVTGYYREQTTWDFFKNSVVYAQTSIFDMLLSAIGKGDD